MATHYSFISLHAAHVVWFSKHTPSQPHKACNLISNFCWSSVLLPVLHMAIEEGRWFLASAICKKVKVYLRSGTERKSREGSNSTLHISTNEKYCYSHAAGNTKCKMSTRHLIIFLLKSLTKLNCTGSIWPVLDCIHCSRKTMWFPISTRIRFYIIQVQYGKQQEKTLSTYFYPFNNPKGFGFHRITESE